MDARQQYLEVLGYRIADDIAVSSSSPKTEAQDEAIAAI